MSTELGTHRQAPSASPGDSVTAAGVCLFAIPKPFEGHIGTIQRNAIASWKRLGNDVDIVLFGDAAGTSQIAVANGVRHCREIKCNELGTPLVSDAFAQVQQWTSAPVLVYCNADLILLRDFYRSVKRLCHLHPAPFLAIGRRINIDCDREIDFSRIHEIEGLMEQSISGRAESIMCKDYFVYRRDTFQQLPAFAVGRGNWDSWLVRTARNQGVPVVDLTECASVLHQTHTYNHVAGGRAASYVFGPEARQNQQAAGGKNWIAGAVADWELTPFELRPRRMARFHLPFWFDLPRAVRLAAELLWGRKNRSTRSPSKDQT